MVGLSFPDSSLEAFFLFLFWNYFLFFPLMNWEVPFSAEGEGLVLSVYSSPFSFGALTTRSTLWEVLHFTSSRHAPEYRARQKSNSITISFTL